MEKRDIILIVDDMEINRAILRGVFEKGYKLLEAENGEQAMQLVGQYHTSIAVMLLDLVMPVKDGYSVMSEITSEGYLNEFPVVIITAEDTVDTEVQAFDLGASDIIMKPFEPHVVRRRVDNIIELNLHKLNQDQLIEEQSEKLRESNSVLIDALSSIIEYRSIETGQHVRRIRMFTKILLEDVSRSYPEYMLNDHSISVITSASSMHDIGKIAIPDAILNKPGRLTPEEFEIMKTHAVKGCEILAGLDRMGDAEYLRYAYNICRYHHERWDGRGYPDGLRGDGIPICAQVVGVADCYDALTTDRVYKKAIPPEQAINMILNGECGCFSPKLLESLKNVQSAFSELSAEHADRGLAPGAASSPALPGRSPAHSDSLDTLQMGQIKYYSLLKYLDSTVMEVDLQSGLYHVVYMSGEDFEPLRSGARFDESIRAFAEASVHPDDRATVLRLLDGYIDEFFREGLMKRTRCYRVYCRADKTYHLCDATLIRIDADSPHLRKAMIIWRVRQYDDAQPRPDSTAESAALREVIGCCQSCRNDRWFTMDAVGKSLQEFTGYTAAEFADKFQNRFINLICAEDRADVIRQFKAQQQEGRYIEIEYRIETKSGRLMWVLDKSQLLVHSSGDEYIYSVLIDITRSRHAQDKLRFLMERYRMIMEQTNDVVFEWDAARDTISYTPNWKKKFGYEPLKENASKALLRAAHVHPEDMAAFSRFIQSIASGLPFGETELRIADGTGSYRWCRIRAASQSGRDGAVIKAVGVLTDVDDEKRASQELMDQAERDSLTMLLNKRAVRRRVNDYLKQRRQSDLAAMFIIDVDDFKLINDTYGHMFGDVVLQEIASELQRLFRSGDIISRFGGDEFLIFMQDIRDRSIVAERAGRIIEAIRNILLENMTERRPSCSIGVAVCPDNGTSYDDLFRCSDLALYNAKSQGKNCFSVYDRDRMDGQFGSPRIPSAANTRIDSESAAAECPEEPAVPSSLAGKLFAIFKGEDNLDAAMASALKLIGIRFGVSRVHVFEDSEDGSCTTNTFEWCADGIAPTKGSLIRLSYASLGNYKEAYSENGIFYCPDVSVLPSAQRGHMSERGLKSLLNCAITEAGVRKGFVGLDDCVRTRIWTKDQIDELSSAASILSVFLLKKRSQEKAVAYAENLRTILDSQDACICVVDPESHRLLYINEKIYSHIPAAAEGMLCHSAFYGREKPCSSCPMNTGRRELNPHPGSWSSVSASRIRWDGRSVFLLTGSGKEDSK